MLLGKYKYVLTRQELLQIQQKLEKIQKIMQGLTDYPSLSGPFVKL